MSDLLSRLRASANQVKTASAPMPPATLPATSPLSPLAAPLVASEPSDPGAQLRAADRRLEALRAIREGLSLDQAAKDHRLKRESLRALVIATVQDLEKPALEEAREIRKAILARKEDLLKALWPTATAKRHVHSFDKEGQPNIVDGPSVPHARLALDLIKEVEKGFGLEAPTRSKVEISGTVAFGAQYDRDQLAEAERRLTAVVEAQALGATEGDESEAEVVRLDERR